MQSDLKLALVLVLKITFTSLHTCILLTHASKHAPRFSFNIWTSSICEKDNKKGLIKLFLWWSPFRTRNKLIRRINWRWSIQRLVMESHFSGVVTLDNENNCFRALQQATGICMYTYMIDAFWRAETEALFVSPVNSLPKPKYVENWISDFVGYNQYIHSMSKGLNLSCQSLTLSLQRLFVGAIYMILESVPLWNRVRMIASSISTVFPDPVGAIDKRQGEYYHMYIMYFSNLK